MKTKKSLIVMLWMMLLFTITVSVPESRVSAVSTGSLTNVLKAPKAASGKWSHNSKGYRYKFKKSGTYAKQRWLKISKNFYYFTKSGYAKTGMLNYNGRNYYFTSKGKLVTGWKTIGKDKYYFWKSSSKGAVAGSAAVSLVKISGAKYYFDKDGKMCTKWVRIGNNYYYFYPSTGKMAVNTTIDGYRVDSTGRRLAVVQPTANKVDIWVGDSRTVGLGETLKISSRCIAEVGQGYEWYRSTAEAKLKAKLNKNPTSVVVFAFGVNDLGNYNKYISKYKEIIKKYPKAKFYFLSVNPIDFKKYKSPWATDKMIQTFNSALKSAFPNQYIDSYTMVKPYVTYSKTNKTYSTKYTDDAGLHYRNGIYEKIYTLVNSKV